MVDPIDKLIEMYSKNSIDMFKFIHMATYTNATKYVLAYKDFYNYDNYSRLTDSPQKFAFQY